MVLIPAKSLLALLDPVLNIDPAVIDLDHLGLGQPGVGHDEIGPREQLASMSFDLADHPPRLVPVFGLVAEVDDPDLDAVLGWPAYRSPEMGFDQLFKVLVGREPAE